MIFIDNIFVAESVLDTEFQCAITKCKGACCEAGDFGAPLSLKEKDKIVNSWKEIKKELSIESVDRIESNGFSHYYESEKFVGTPLHNNGRCVYAIEQEGNLLCGIEASWRKGNSQIKKPISCELYPVREETIPENGLVSLRYDKWEICNPACKNGKDNGVKLYEFLKDAFVRRFGERFYNLLSAYADQRAAKSK